MAPALTCHSRWCKETFQASPDCTNISAAIETLFPNDLENPIGIACCKLFCGERSQLLQLQCQGVSEKMAILIWVMVAVLVLCAAIQLVAISLERGARKVAMVGGPLFLAFIAVVVYLVTDEVYIHVDTPFYPIVGAMNVAAFSYFFSSFQYSISLSYELASATALVFTMLPIWTLLTVQMNTLLDSQHEFDSGIRGKVWEMAGLVLAMLILSLLWIIHSSLYRTVGYRASWITAFNKQMANGRTLPPGTNFMKRLWMLAGAQGHPTWRTPAGQSIGLSLAVLSWVIAVSTHHLLQGTCKEDLILFHIMLWVPPAILTAAVLVTHITMVTQVTMCFGTAPCDSQENHSLLLEWFLVEFETLWKFYQHMEEAVISYRLGRDTLEVESSIEKYRLAFCGGQIQWVDKFVAALVFFIEAVILGIVYPGVLVARSLCVLGLCVLNCTPIFYWFQRRQRFLNSLREKMEAYRTLREHCLAEDIRQSEQKSKVYERSRKNGHDGLTLDDVDKEVCNIFREHHKMIRLPLLLDNIGPSRLSYLLEKLAVVMNNSEPRGGGSHNGTLQHNGTINLVNVPPADSSSTINGDQQLSEPEKIPSNSAPSKFHAIDMPQVTSPTDTTTVQALTSQHGNTQLSVGASSGSGPLRLHLPPD